MQQRQLRLGDILDDYCPRERRVTNHAVVAMVGAEVRQTRCTTCDAEHEYKHARVPRPRVKAEPAAAPSGAPALPRRPVVAPALEADSHREEAEDSPLTAPGADAASDAPFAASPAVDESIPDDQDALDDRRDDGPVHRPLIRATLPRIEGQAPTRPATDFTIRQPAGRGQRFKSRYQRTDAFSGHRSNGGGNSMRGGARPHSGRGQQPGRPGNRRGPDRRRQK